jgi:ABC-type transporter MlaC component
MNKGRTLLSRVTVLLFLIIVNSAAIAQEQSAESQMDQNLRDVSELLKDISAQLSTGKMSPEAQKTAGKITQQVSQLLRDLAGIGSETRAKHRSTIKKLNKTWDPWKRMQEEEN